jgi:hypothetical protein
MKQKNKYKEEDSLEKKLVLLKKVSLGDAEKERMKSFLSRYVEMHPVLEGRERVLRERRNKYTFILSFLGRAVHALAVGVFFVWGSIAFAESSLPGSPLYGLKIKSESMRQNFIFDQEERAHFEAGRISRRLDEAHALIQKGAVSGDVTERFARELEENLLSFRESLDNLNSKEKQMAFFGIEKTCNSRLNTYKNIFAKMAENDASVVAFLNELALRFDLPSGYFEHKGNVAIATMDTPNEEVESVLFVETEEGLPPEEELAQKKDEEKSGSGLSETVDLLAVNQEQFLESEILAIDISELKKYTSARIKAAEKSLGRTRIVDERIRSAFKRQLEYATTLYERGVLIENEKDKSIESQSHFLRSLDVAEELLVLAEMSDRKLSDFLFQFILDELAKSEEKTTEVSEESTEEESSIDSAEEEVKGSREVDESMDDEEKEEEPTGEDDNTDTIDIDEVREILDGVGL